MSQADHILDGIFSAEVTTTNDVQKELQLSTADMQTLINIAKRGGEVSWSWNVKNESREKVADLIQGGYLVEREYCKSPLDMNPALALRLTDKARNVIAKHDSMRVNIGSLRKLTG